MLTMRLNATAAGLGLIAITLTATHAGQSDDTVVTIDSGAIEGAVSGEVESFKGIPYAAPPVRALRWQPPQPVAPWSGVRLAKTYGPDCMQKPVGGDVAPTAGGFSEDCLFVSVWRPAAMKAGARLPVFVWIHGGGFLNGGTSDPYSDASARAPGPHRGEAELPSGAVRLLHASRAGGEG
jgi:para-nitrobenzyl esterase